MTFMPSPFVNPASHRKRKSVDEYRGHNVYTVKHPVL
jgi:hypothetical protein